MKRKDNTTVRFAIVVPRSTSKSAVVRNRLKRRTTEWFRKSALRRISPGDYVVSLNAKAVAIPRKDYYQALSRAFRV